MNIQFLLDAMKLGYRLCESKHVNFRNWICDEELNMEMALHLDSLLANETIKLKESEVIDGQDN